MRPTQNEHPSALQFEARWLALLVGAALLVRLAAVLYLDFPVESDAASYRAMAINLLAGHGIVDDMGNRAMYNVGYPLFVLAPVFALTGNSLLAAQLANVLLGGLTVWLVWRLTKRVSAVPWAAALAAGLYAAYVPAWLQCEYLSKENLMTPLVVALAWSAVSIAASPRRISIIVAGTLLGALALVGSAALAFIPAILVAIYLGTRQLARTAVLGAAVAVVALLVVAPWMARNHVVLGAPVLNTNGGFNLYLGNNPAATGMFVSISDTPMGAQWAKLRTQGEVFASSVLRDEAVAWIAADPLRFALLGAKKVGIFWTPPVHEGEGSGSAFESFMRAVWLLEFLLIVVGAVLGLVIQGGRSKATAVLWLMVLGYTTLHAFFYVIFRYREPLLPLMCVSAGLTCASAFQWARVRREQGVRSVPHA